MPLSAGTSLGPYRIEASLGAVPMTLSGCEVKLRDRLETLPVRPAPVE